MVFRIYQWMNLWHIAVNVLWSFIQQDLISVSKLQENEIIGRAFRIKQ